MSRRPRSGPPASDASDARAAHLDLQMRVVDHPDGPARVLVDDSESPLAWFAKRKGKDGRALISQEQFIAGERLRADFTRAQMTPRVTSHWGAPGGKGSGGRGEISDVILAAKQRVRRALEMCGPEFSGLLLDVCCFLRGLEDIERERGWPTRSGKVVLLLGLDRLARHYGIARSLEGADSRMRSWSET